MSRRSRVSLAMEAKDGGKLHRNPSAIKNKMKRQAVYAKLKSVKKAERRTRREENKRKATEAGELGEEAPRKKQKTIESEREVDPTFVSPDDLEVFGDEAGDEFASIFGNEIKPKIMITTRPKPSKHLFRFIADLMTLLPKSFYYERKSFDVKQICQFATNKKFTHLIVLGEDKKYKKKMCNGMIVSRLPDGPTAFFKVSNVQISTDLKSRGKSISQQPEIILNNFNTRLGRRVGRFLGSLYPHEPNFKGREVVTFHNQRDFIFVRYHRYIFDETEVQREGEKKDPKKTELGVKARLQELGPRFTLKLRWLQQGSFDTLHGEYEWLHRRGEMDGRRKFHL